MSIKRVTVKILTVLAILIVCPSVWAATYYVSGNSGNDSNPGTLANPWKTINKANDTLKPGDTAYIRQGTYNETIRPSTNGTSGNYLTFARYNDEQVTITGVHHGVDVSNRQYIIIDGFSILDVGGFWVNMEYATHNIIRNCYMKGARGWSGFRMHFGANYNKIQNNILVATTAGPDDAIHLRQDASYNIIENNNISYAVHMGLSLEVGGTVERNVIRNNVISNPWHTSLGIYKVADHNLIEGNIIKNAGAEVSSDTGHGFQLGASDNIIRKNIFQNNKSSLKMTAWTDYPNHEASRNRIYNNTFYDNVIALEANHTGPVEENVVKNNVFWNNSTNIKRFYNGVEGILSYNSEGEDPHFVDAGNDFSLKATSPMIDSGDYLTRTTSTGTGTTIPVEDAAYFMDGWGIIEGDQIKLQGQDRPVKILKVETNKITVDQNITWKSGDGIGLIYNDTAVDIGAIEYTSNLNILKAPTGLKIVTPN